MSNFEKKVVPYLTYLGTRPPTVDEWEKYDLHHRARLATKPGITGMWQVSGRSNITDFEDVVKLDKKYIAEWSVGLDIKILLKAKEMILYSLPLIPNKVSWTIINLSDRIILMNVLGSDATGLYAVSYKFPNLMDTVYGFFYQSWKESSARALKEENQDDFYNSVYENLKNFMFSLVLGMTAFMPLVFFILINKNYYAALPYIPVLLLATYFSNMSGFYGGIFTAYKDTKIMGTTTVAAAIINLSVNLLMIRKFGIYAAAVSTLVANFVVYVYRKIKVRKYIKLKENWKKSIFAVIFTVVEFAFFYTMNKMLWMAGCAMAVFYAFFLNRSMMLFVIKKMKTKILGAKNENRKTK